MLVGPYCSTIEGTKRVFFIFCPDSNGFNLRKRCCKIFTVQFYSPSSGSGARVEQMQQRGRRNLLICFVFLFMLFIVAEYQEINYWSIIIMSRSQILSDRLSQSMLIEALVKMKIWCWCWVAVGVGRPGVVWCGVVWCGVVWCGALTPESCCFTLISAMPSLNLPQWR